MLRTQVRRMATLRAYTVRRVAQSGATDTFKASPRDLVDQFGMLPRDCQLLATSSSHIAIREGYFLFRFPPFTGAVRHDMALLISDADNHAASESLRERLVHLTQSAPPPNDPHALSFEHRVLEAVLHEDTLYKRDRYLRLSQLISSATTPEATSKYSLSIDGYQQYHQIREASLYRLLTLSRSLKALSFSAFHPKMQVYLKYPDKAGAWTVKKAVELGAEKVDLKHDHCKGFFIDY